MEFSGVEGGRCGVGCPLTFDDKAIKDGAPASLGGFRFSKERVGHRPTLPKKCFLFLMA
jgi:hypothetical protein